VNDESDVSFVDSQPKSCLRRHQEKPLSMQMALTDCGAHHFDISISPSFVQFLLLPVVNVGMVYTRPDLPFRYLLYAICDSFRVLKHVRLQNKSSSEQESNLLTETVYDPRVSRVIFEDVVHDGLNYGRCRRRLCNHLIMEVTAVEG